MCPLGQRQHDILGANEFEVCCAARPVVDRGIYAHSIPRAIRKCICAEEIGTLKV